MRFKKLDKALEEIEALGYEVKVFEDPTIFQTDALYKMQTDKYVFYYNQSVNKMDNGRQIVHLNWNGSAKDIIEVLKKHRLEPHGHDQNVGSSSKIKVNVA